MPASNVQTGSPLTRLTPFYPPQWGVRGSDNKLGLRQHSTGAIFYVDPNHPDCNDAGDGTDPEHPMQHVAAALLLCAAFRGDEIHVMSSNAWQYGNPLQGNLIPVSENVIVTVPGVRIVGVSKSSSTGVVWTPASNGGTCITVNALDVLIEGFLFTQGIVWAGCNAISAEWNGPTEFGDNLTVRNCMFDPSVDVAISLNYVWYANIHHNTFWQCDDAGIQAVNPGHGAVDYLEISENILHDCANHAMDLPGCDNSHIWNNSIYNTDAQAGAAATDEGILTTGGSGNQVFDNYFSCLLPAAAPGDYNDLNTAAATDAWIGNHCMNGLAITNPT